MVTREEACFVMSLRGCLGGVKTKVTRTSLNWSKQTSKEVTANNHDAFEQTGSSFFCFDLAGWDYGSLLVSTQTDGKVKIPFYHKFDPFLPTKQAFLCVEMFP